MLAEIDAEAAKTAESKEVKRRRLKSWWSSR